MDKYQKYQKITHTVCAICIGLVILILFFVSAPKPSGSNLDSVPPNFIEFFSNIKIEGKSAVVYDSSTGKILYSKNETYGRPLASIAKLMTVLTAKELGLDGKVPIGPDSLNAIAVSDLWIGDSWNKKDISDYTLLSSSNDGAAAIAAIDDEFVDKMNTLAASLDMSESRFQNPHGLDVSDTVAGAYGSAMDVARLMAYILQNHPELLEATTHDRLNFDSSYNHYRNVKNTNKIVGRIPHILGSKTGFTELAGGNLVIAFDIPLNHPIIVVVLGSSEDGRFTDTQLLINKALEYFQSGGI